METALRSRSPHEPTDLLRSAVNLAAELTRFRDADTGLHLERVSHYARLIARALPPAEGLDDEFIDDLSCLAPAHDIGKVAIPDHILLKQGVFTRAEFEVMKSHVTSGVAVVEELIRDFALGGSAHVSMLRNIVRSHHEALDGSGYPDGLKAGEIPLEARIVAVADFSMRSRAKGLTREPGARKRPSATSWSEKARVRRGLRGGLRGPRRRGRIDSPALHGGRCRLSRPGHALPMPIA